jgi:hypothetical protein
MNFLFWNIRGVNHPSKQKEVKSMIQRHNISLVCLIETKVQEHNVDRVKSCIVPEWDYVANYNCHFLGRIWVCWKKSVYSVNVIDMSMQSINCEIKILHNNHCWFHSFVYGANSGVDRRIL